MKRSYIILMLLAGMTSNVLAANQHTFSLGYSHVSLGIDDSLFASPLNFRGNGINANYRYEIDNRWGITSSLSWIRQKNQLNSDALWSNSANTNIHNKPSHNNDPTFEPGEATESEIEAYDTKTKSKASLKKANYLSLLIGPTYRLNKYVSVYSMAGVSSIKISAGVNNNNVTSFIKKGAALSAGIQVNPIEHIAITVGYETAFIKNIKNTNIFNVGVGYRF